MWFACQGFRHIRTFEHLLLIWPGVDKRSRDNVRLNDSVALQPLATWQPNLLLADECRTSKWGQSDSYIKSRKIPALGSKESEASF